MRNNYDKLNARGPSDLQTHFDVVS